MISRWYALERPLPAAKPQIRTLTDRVTPQARNRDFPQAMMDLGSGICTPRSPTCLLCPVSAGCAAFAAGTQTDFPRKAPKKQRPTRHGLAYWIEHDGAVLLTRRPETSLLGGMMEVPGSDWIDAGEPAPQPAVAGVVRDGVGEHTFTHFHLQVQVVVPEADPDATITALGLKKKGATWAPIEDLNRFALPTIMKKIVRHALKNI